jgi:hypothetical protein
MKVSAKCHPNRPERQGGLCAKCLTKARNEDRKPDCHPERRYHAKGLCSGCYFKQKQRAECHPDQPYRARGLCGNCYARIYMWERRSKVRARERVLRRDYGIGVDEYDALRIAQGGRCAICGDESDRTLAVDHDHATGQVRGLLCIRCNRAIGNLRDDPDLALRAAAYLERARERVA